MVARIRQNDYTDVMAKIFFLFQQLKHAISRKTIVFLLATVLLHSFFFKSAIWQDWTPQSQQKSKPAIRVHLQPIAEPQQTAPKAAQKTVAPAQKVATNVTTKAAPKSMVRAKPKTKNQPWSPDPIVTQALTLDEPKFDPLPGQEISSASSPSATEETRRDVIVRIPNSVELTLAVTHTKVNDTPTRGVATLSWQIHNDRYNLKLEVGVNLVITTLNLYTLSSDGEIGPFGLMPSTSIDERKTKAATAIHFNYMEKAITFSASNKTITMREGAQDAASLLLQLAAMGNGDPAQFALGREFSIQVAEGRDANDFMFQVVAHEEIDSQLVLGQNKLSTIHIVRAPRPGAYNSRLDIWLAPSLSWYPVQIRNTESSGTVTNQIVTALKNRVNQYDQ